MEAVIASEEMISKAERRRITFINASREVEESKETRDEQVSLESAFRRFIKSPHVIAYYSLTPLILTVLENVKQRCIGEAATGELKKYFDTLARKTPLASKQPLAEVNQTLDGLERSILKLVAEVEEVDENEAELLVEVLTFYWARKRLAYLTNDTNTTRLSQGYVLQSLIGINVADKKGDMHEEEWRETLWEYLSDFDRDHMRLIATLDETKAELDTLYFAMHNDVSYQSLVMLAMWRFRQNKNGKNVLDIVDLLGGEGEEEVKWTLAYGEFFKDYQLFMQWHRHDFEGHPVRIHLYYIDFKASASSKAILIDMKRDDTVSVAMPFASIFVNHSEYLPLSCMVPHTNKVLHTKDVEEASLPTKKKTGFRSLFTT